jgi:hypothetical protein
MILEISDTEIAQLSDPNLRTLVGYLCEREVAAAGYSPSAVTWGGHQNAGDGGVDVRVALLPSETISGYIPRSSTGLQVKAQNMRHGDILKEMAPDGTIRPSILQLAAEGGAYVIVSSQGSVSDTSLQARRAAMAEAVKGLPNSSALRLEFYDRRRVASWVNQHPGVVAWVREVLGLPVSGWQPFEDWSSSPAPLDAPYLVDTQTRLVGPSIHDTDGLNTEAAIEKVRGVLRAPRGVVRLVGLSGVGKTRFIQALFDPRIGSNVLLQSDALYTDVSDNPDPSPQEMLSRLISLDRRVVLIVDNCSVELHRKLATRIAQSNCKLSLITVEYDINDDEPPNTEVFRLEPASSELIDRLLQLRYSAVAPPSRRVIVAFSEGNARVAFALAETAKSGESLAGLNDTELFHRLFYQQKTPSSELLEAASACSLVYSFDGETLQGKDAELEALATVIGQTVDQLYKNVAELHERQLVQKRGRWRAILPHAVANRLAKRALNNIPPQRIEDAIICGGRERLLRTFSRRMGYLHGSDRAAELATKWLAPGGLLSPLGQLNELGEEILENIAPIDPVATLSYIEAAARTSPDQFFGATNRNKDQIVRLLRSLAYDPAQFGHCVVLLSRFSLSESSGNEQTLDILKSLFWVHLSGTHAPLAHRGKIVVTLLHSQQEEERTLGLSLLDAMLETIYFNTRHSFEFGAWKRDFGIYPKTADETKQWFARALDIACDAFADKKISPERIRQSLADHIPGLLEIGMVDELTALVKAQEQPGGWPEGWIGVRKAVRRIRPNASPSTLETLDALEQSLRPKDLPQLVRAYALSPEGTALDIAEVDSDDPAELLAAREQVFQLCLDLGKQLAVNAEPLNVLLPELLTSDSRKVATLGEGLAVGCQSLRECWDHLRDRFLAISETLRKSELLSGFLSGAMARSPEEADGFLDDALGNPALHPYLVYWQGNAGIKGNAFERMLTALTLESVRISSFAYFKFGRIHEGFDDEQFSTLLNKLMDRKDGRHVAAELLGMRIFGRQADKWPITESLRDLSMKFLSDVALEQSDRHDQAIGSAIRIGLGKPEHEDQARALCVRLLQGVSGWKVHAWEFPETIAALTDLFPTVVLDTLLEQSAHVKGAAQVVLQDLVRHRIDPFAKMPEETWIRWAALKPETRYELLASVIPFSGGGENDPATGWFPSALRLIEMAPDPVPVLNAFRRRFYPGSWHGSLAQILASRLPLIEGLRQHPHPQIAGWANDNAATIAAQIERERAAEGAESDAQNSTFE